VSAEGAPLTHEPRNLSSVRADPFHREIWGFFAGGLAASLMGPV